MTKIEKACNCKDGHCGTQVEIGVNGEVVTISLAEYEELLEYKSKYKQLEK
jgi:hypothetical protein